MRQAPLAQTLERLKVTWPIAAGYTLKLVVELVRRG